MSEKFEREPFSCHSQPKVNMPIKTKCERVQPTATGVDKKGELIWEGRQMPRWQMEMFRSAVDMFGVFFKRWLDIAIFQRDGDDLSKTSNVMLELPKSSKERLDGLRRAVKAPRRPRRVNGD